MAFVTASIFKKEKKDFLLITSSVNEAQLVYSNLSALVEKDDILFFPNEEAVRLKKISVSKEIAGERIYALSVLSGKRRPKIVICNFRAVLRYLTTPEKINANTISIKKNSNLNIKELKEMLVQGGFQKVDKITASLQFATRGDIIDVFPINRPHPIRIDFFDDTIEEIREFRISTQQSFASLEALTIFPGSEHLITKSEINNALRTVDLLLPLGRLDENGMRTRDFLIEELDKADLGLLPLGLERFTKLFGFEMSSIMDFLNNPTVFCYNYSSIQKEYGRFIERDTEYNIELCRQGESIPNLKSTHDISMLESEIINKSYVLNGKLVSSGIRYTRNPSVKDDLNLSYLNGFLLDGYHVDIAVPDKESLQSLVETLRRRDIAFSLNNTGRESLNLLILPLISGFIYEDEKYVLLLESDLFLQKRPISRFISHYKEGSSLESYLDLEIGDYVVHELYGIARYRGLEHINSFGVVRDCLRLEYANDEFVNVPVLQIDYIRKFLGRDGYCPALSRLHTKDWERLKKRVKQEINDNYEKLLELYQKRIKEPGIIFKPLPELENELIKSCPFELTLDQTTSVVEVFSDMNQPFPMDRLLCGDVGFGKTEVALRAAMRAVVNDHQVCVVCPTTILASQHYELFKTRFEQIGFKVALLSRFVSKREQRVILSQLNKGEVDVLIATHRAIGKDVVFKHLGLLIIDEEQRFGVKQKEAIKHKYPTVDVLTLSATPIPRTLQMSLLNLRPVSRITTPPPYRNPIQTYVVRDEEQLIKEIIEQELERNGQVFYLSNRVQGISEKVAYLEATIPAARVGLIHGQLDAATIEDELYRFYTQDINVLVCTTIIENGIDYPNANTLIVENAEKFGLAQLYQIKGRVGRSDRIAYAYLMYANDKITDTGTERLKAIQQFTDLGSGYKIAEQDLLIRGAGEIIGENQSGFISNVGLDMYTKLFDDVMYERKNNQERDKEKKADISLFDSAIREIDTNDDQKMELYQRLSRVDNFKKLDAFRTQIEDEFGKLPDGMENLLAKKTLDLYTNVTPIIGITEETDTAMLMVDSNSFVLIRRDIANLEDAYIKFSRFTPGEIRIKKRINYLEDLIRIAKTITEVWSLTKKRIFDEQKV